MEQIELEISKDESGNIVIKSSEEKRVVVDKNENKLKATDVVNLLDYTEEKTYKIAELSEEYSDDKNLVFIMKVFEQIIENLND